MLRITFLSLLLTALISPLSAQQKTEKLKGLLWEISGNGISKPGYLYGTMHVSEKLVFNLSDSFFIALKNVDMVALETDHDRWQQFTDNLMSQGELSPFGESGFSPTRQRYQNFYSDGFQFEAPSKEMLGSMLSVKPVMTNEFLYRSNEYQQDYEEDTYLDLFIFQAGKKLGKKVIGLETLEGSYESVLRARIPDESEEDRRRNYYGGGNMPSLEDAYRDQDLNMIDSINQMSSPGKNFKRFMLDERNIVMANRIDSVLRSGTAIFSAVGAAHLPGDAGVIQLLRKKGYTMRAVQFTDQAGTSDKDAIDKLHYPVKLSRHFLRDSSWSAETPGDFYPTFNVQGLEQHLNADMSNGVFYAIYRLRSNGWWAGQTQQYITDRIDSLIYERIPGKINERKRISEPFPGHEITSRTRRGDIQRFKIFVTPSEIVLFTVGGNGDYANGEEATRFLNSIQYHIPAAKSPKPFVFKPKHGAFQVKFPATPFYNNFEYDKANQYTAIAESPADSAVYFLYRTEYHDWEYIEEDSFEMNIIGEKIAEHFTKTLPKQHQVSEAPYPTQDLSFRADKGNFWYFVRIVIDGPRYYILGCRKPAPAFPTDFFDSFSITPTVYPEGFSETNDTTYKFRVSSLPPQPAPGKVYAERLKKIYEEIAQKSKHYGGYDEDYDWSDDGEKFTTLESPLTGEQVTVRVFKAPASLSYPSVDSLKTSIRNSFSQGKKLAIRESNWEDQKGVLVGNFLMEDTNSTRGIRGKIFIQNRQSYRIMATVNLKAPESAFIQSVFNSFAPSNALDGTSLFGQRDLSFLQKIYAKDSLERNTALDALHEEWRLEFQAQDFPLVRHAIEDPGFSKLKFRDRKILITALHNFKTPETVQYLLQFEHMNRDSARYTAAVLETLAQLKTKESFTVLLDQLTKEPTFFDSENNVFSAFSDTLQLTATMFPRLLKLADLDAFRPEVIKLLNNLTHEGLIKPKSYRSLKPMLLRETSWDITRNQYRAEEKRERSEAYYNAYDATLSQQDVVANLELLAPFFKKDQAAKDVAEKALAVGDKTLQITVYGLYLRNDIPVPEEKLKPFTENLETQYPLFLQLALAGKCGQYKQWFSDTTRLIESYLVSSKSAGYGYQNVDSIRFISRHPYVRFNQPAYLYLFDVKQKKDKEWGLAQLITPRDLKFFSPTGAKRIASTPFNKGYMSYRERPQVRVMMNLTGKNKETYIHKKLEDMRFANRARYRSSNEDNYYAPSYD